MRAVKSNRPDGKVRIFCWCCNEHQPIFPINISKDDLNNEPWDDIVCAECRFVITSVRADEPGRYELVRVDDD